MPNMISIKLLCNFIEIALRHGCSPVGLLHILRTRFYKDTSGGLLLSHLQNKNPFKVINSFFLKQNNRNFHTS